MTLREEAVPHVGLGGVDVSHVEEKYDHRCNFVVPFHPLFALAFGAFHDREEENKRRRRRKRSGRGFEGRSKGVLVTMIMVPFQTRK